MAAVWRAFGAALITTSLGGAGFVVARSFELRPGHLRSLQTALALLRTEITYAATPLPEALADIGRRTAPAVGEFTLAVAKQLRADAPLPVADAWRQAVLAQRGRWALTTEDEEVLLDLASALGRSFAHDQEKHLQLALTRLARHQEAATEEAKVHIRLWRYVGLCAAGMLILWLY